MMRVIHNLRQVQITNKMKRIKLARLVMKDKVKIYPIIPLRKRKVKRKMTVKQK